MRRALSTALPALLLTALACTTAQAGSGWATNLKKAKKTAKAKKLPILVEFTGSDWCRPCMVLKKEVFDSKEFKALAKGLVLVQLDFPQRKPQDRVVKERNQRISAKYKIEGFPTVLFLDHEGKEIGRTVGHQAKGKDKWFAKAKSILEKFDPETGKAKDGDHGPKARPKADPARQRKAPAKGSERWTEGWNEALKLSKKTGLPILANFTGSDWCGWCIKLKKEVFDTPEFKAWAREKVILLHLDYPSRTPQAAALKEQNKKLAATYKVKGFPTILFLNAKGEPVGRTGYVKGGPKAWIAAAEKSLSQR